jgi:hypothetical protein
VLFRRRRLPPELLPALARDERVLAWAWVTAHAVVVATNQGLFLPGRDQRLWWHEIHKATWTGRSLVIIPAALVEERQGYEVVADAPALEVTLPEPGDVPQVVRNRVTRSVLFSSHRPVPGGGARVAGRRVPGVDGVTWTVRYDEGTDPAAVAVRDVTSQLVAEVAAGATDPTL